MKSMKFIITALFFFMCFNSFGQMQNSQLITPPKILENNQQGITLNTLPTQNPNIGYDGLPASNASNAMQDANGDLLFFIVDGEVYDKDGFTIGIFDDVPNSPPFQVKGTSEITIVPNPTNCSQYYIFMAGRNDYSGQASKIPVVAILDMSQPTDYGANLGKMGRILYCQTIQSVLPSSAPDFLISNSGKQGLTFFAASKEKEGKRFVFISSPARIFRFVIDANGFQYDGNIQFRDYSNPSTDFIVNTYDQIPYRGEMELIGIDNDTDVKYRIAVSMPMKYNDINAPNASSVYYANLDASGELIADQNGIEEDIIQYIHNSGSSNGQPHIHGIEFSPNGNILYITHQWNNTYMNSFDYFDFNNISAGTQPVPGVSITESRNFEYSQIEIGKTGKLYLAYAGGLATFTHPNTPNIGVLDLTAHTFPYSPNIEGTNSNKESLISYMLPDQIDGMDYSINAYPSIHNVAGYTASVNATWQPNLNPWGVSNSDIYMHGDLIIPSGINVTIQNMTFRFGPDAKVIIEQGAKLTIDKSIFTNGKVACDNSEGDYWQGIQVWGTTHQHQFPQMYPDHQGMLVLKNGGTIEYAHKAATNWKEGSWSQIGGVIQSKDGIFKNNRRGVEFMAYKNHTPNNPSNEINNFSYFTNTAFLTDDDFIEGYPQQGHVSLWKVKGVNFKNCHFANNLTTDKTVSSAPRDGIYALDASFSVTAACSGPIPPLGQPCPTSQLLRSSFTGLQRAVQIAGAGITETATISQTDFISNTSGIFVDEFNNVNINRNDFFIGDAGYSTAIHNQGIYLDNSTGFIVEENSVLGSLYFSNAHGITVNNSGPDNNRLYKNKLHTIKVGTRADRVNYSCDEKSGLQFLCNDYQNNQTAIVSNYNESTHGVRIYQGEHSPEKAAGNTFVDNNLEIENNTRPMIYYHDNNSIGQTPNYTGLVNVILTDQSNPCPTSFGPHIIFGNITPVLDSINIVLDSLNISYTNLFYNYISLIDGGDTDLLQSKIETNWSNDAWTLRWNLLQESPYLSEHALLTAASENVLPNAMLLEVLLANPDATSGEHFIQELNEVTNYSMPEYMLDYVRNNWDEETIRTALEAEISSLQTDISTSINFIQYLEKSKEEHTYLDRYNIVKMGKGISNKIDLMDFFIENSEWARADSVLLAIENDEDMQTDLEFVEDFDNYIAFRSGLGDRNLAQLDSSEIIYLQTLAEKGTRASGYAENILCFFYDICYEKDMGEGSPMAKMLTIPAGGVPTLEEIMYNITVYPNPANTFTSMKWEIYDELNNTHYKIFDLNGREMGSGTIEENKGETVIDTRNLLNGVYLVNIYNNGILKLNSKLVVSKEK